jgi:hypothetical protein
MTRINTKIGLIWGVLLLGLATCSPAAEQAAPTIPASVSEETAAVIALPTGTEPPAEPIAPATAETPAGETVETTAPESNGVISGRTAEGTYFLGAEDALVTMIDYSDFL